MNEKLRHLRVWVTGGQGLLGSAVCRLLEKCGVNFIAPNSRELDLLDFSAITRFVDKEKPDIVIHLASKVYGLKGNIDNQFDVLSYNTRINDNVFAAIKGGSVKRVFFAGTVAAYPFPYSHLPLTEDQFFKGSPHSGEYGYAVSKIHAYSYLKILYDYHGVDFVFGAFTNLYGPGDRFDIDSGHVIPSLIKKAFLASKENGCLNVWGRSDTTRDFLYVDDAATAILRLCEAPSGIYNISTGIETSLGRVVECISGLSHLSHSPVWQSDKPVGIPRRVVSCDKLKDLGWSPMVSIEDGLKLTYQWYSTNFANSR